MRITTFIFLALSTAIFAQEPAAENTVQAPREVAPGVFEIGGIRIDKNTLTASFPAKVNMVDGLVEYIIVTTKGPTHESILATEVSPKNLHIAMLLLGAKGMAIAKGAPPPERIDAEYLANAPKLEGDSIFITCKWKDADGTEKTVPIERWLMRRQQVARKKPLDLPAEEGPWIYTGSFMHEGRFNAEAMGIFGAVVTFPGALINNPRKGSNDDHLWFVKTNAIPPLGANVEVSIRIEPPKNPETKTK